MPRARKTPQRAEVIPLTPIRVEGELVGLPFHTISGGRSSSDDGRIVINKTDGRGGNIFWKVIPNPGYGAPGELAYKLDKLLIDRKLENRVENLGKIIPLGSLREICTTLGISTSGGNTTAVKKALLQNAFAAIELRKTIKKRDGTQKYYEGAFTRYSVVFTGEELPIPGEPKADQVYIILHDLYLAYLQQVGTRPLNYEYLKILPPSSQRFYELVSPKIFACIKYKHPYARYLYSEFCEMAPVKRYTERGKMRRQMTRLLKPHKECEYIAHIGFKEIFSLDQGGKDWEIQIHPGKSAHREYKAFTSNDSSLLASQILLIEDDKTEIAQAIVRRFWKHKGVTSAQGLRKKDIELAQELLNSFGREKVEFCIDYAFRGGEPPKFFSGVVNHLTKAVDLFEKKKKGKEHSSKRRNNPSHLQIIQKEESQEELEELRIKAERLGLKWRPEEK